MSTVAWPFLNVQINTHRHTGAHALATPIPQLYLPLIDIIIFYSHCVCAFFLSVRSFICSLEYFVRHCWMVKCKKQQQQKIEMKNEAHEMMTTTKRWWWYGDADIWRNLKLKLNKFNKIWNLKTPLKMKRGNHTEMDNGWSLAAGCASVQTWHTFNLFGTNLQEKRSFNAEKTKKWNNRKINRLIESIGFCSSSSSSIFFFCFFSHFSINFIWALHCLV